MTPPLPALELAFATEGRTSQRRRRWETLAAIARAWQASESDDTQRAAARGEDGEGR